MRSYNLTLKDKIYLFFQEDSIKRIAYLYPKVYVHHFNWFNKNGIRIPVDFDRYIRFYVEYLIYNYEFRRCK